MSVSSRTLGWLQRTADALNAFLWLIPPLGAALTAALASAALVPAYLVVLYSAAVLCLIALTLAASHSVFRHRAVFERLRYARSEPIFVDASPANNSIGIMFKCHMMNMSQTRSLFVSLRRADLRLQGRTNPDPVLKSEVFIVPPFCEQSFSIAAVPQIDVSQDIKGKLEVEIAYGPSPERMPFVLAYEFEPSLKIEHLTHQGAQVLMTGHLKKYEHRRIA